MKDALGWQLQLKREKANTHLLKANHFCNLCCIEVLAPTLHAEDVWVYFCTSVSELTFCDQMHKHMFIYVPVPYPFLVAKLESFFFYPKVQHDRLMWQMWEWEWVDLTDAELSALCYDWNWNYGCCEEITLADFWLNVYVRVCACLSRHQSMRDQYNCKFQSIAV